MSSDAASCRGCTTLLRQDNDSGLCSICAESGKLFVPEHVFHTPEVQVALAQHDLGPALAAGRRELGLRQRELGARLGLTQSQVSEIERGIHRLTDAEAIANALVVLGIPLKLVGFPSSAPGSVEGEDREAIAMWLRRHRSTTADHSTLAAGPVAPRRTVLRGGIAAVAVAATDSLLPITAPVAPARPMPSWAAAIDAAVRDPGAAMRAALSARPDGPLPATALRQRVSAATGQSLGSDFHALASTLPDLLGHVEAAAVEAARHGDPTSALVALSDTYSVGSWTLIKAGQIESAREAAGRSRRAAEEAGDRVRTAAAVRCEAEVAMCEGDCDRAVETALRATVHLPIRPDENTELAMHIRGAALLTAATAAARGGNRRTAYTYLNAAGDCARALGGTNASWLCTVFGDGNMGIHAGVVIPLELHDLRAAEANIPLMCLDVLPASLAERRGRAMIDVARVLAGLGDDPAATAALLEAETYAPDEVRNHRYTHALLPQLWRRETSGSGVREFAGRCGVGVVDPDGWS